MKSLRVLCLLLFGGVFLCLLSLPALGQPSSDKPASILVYPYFSSKNGDVSLLSITNTNSDHSMGSNGQVRGEVRIHFFYVNLVSGGGTVENPDDDTCEVTNRWETLTPNDTFTALVSAHNPEGAEGWLYIVAKDPQTGMAIDFDYLIGDMLVANPAINFVWSTPAYGFKGLSGPDGPKSFGGHPFTDHPANGGNGDGQPTFTGLLGDQFFGEYQAWPDELFLSSFLEQKGGIKSKLVLLTALDSDWKVKLKMLYFNDSEYLLSQSRDMRCWVKADLEHFFPAADSLPPGDGIFGMPLIQTGWGEFDGYNATNTVSGGPRIENAPILGLIIHMIGAGASPSFQAAHLLHHNGTITERNTNWDLNIHGGLD